MKYYIQDKETDRFFNQDRGCWVIKIEDATAYPMKPFVTYRERVLTISTESDKVPTT